MPGARGIATSGDASLPGDFLTAGVFAPERGARSTALGPGANAAAACGLAPEPDTNSAAASALALLQGADSVAANSAALVPGTPYSSPSPLSK